MACPIDAGESRFAFGDQRFGPQDFVFVVNSGGLGTNCAYLHLEDVAKAAGLVIVHGKIFHDQEETITLKVGIIVTKSQQLFDAGKFEIL